MELINWLSNFKNAVLSNDSKNVRNMIQMALIFKKLFFPKHYIRLLSDWGLCPQIPIISCGWGLCPQTPLCETFSYTSQLTMSPNLDILGKLHIFWLNVSPFSKIMVMCHTHRPRLLTFHSTVSLSHNNPTF